MDGPPIAALALYGVLQAVDGVALKEAVDAGVSAPDAEKAARFGNAETVRWLECDGRHRPGLPRACVDPRRGGLLFTKFPPDLGRVRPLAGLDVWLAIASARRRE